MSLAHVLNEYDYHLPQENIALTPASPRDSAKLLVYDRTSGKTSFDTFKHLAKYLPPRSLLVFNETKVVPARLPTTLPTGGVVELLWIGKDMHSHEFEALSPRTLKLGDILSFGTLTLSVLEKNESIYRFSHTGDAKTFAKLMDKHGHTPIPPYLKNTPLKERDIRKKYQAIFAKRAGSVAAPTASLHFTKSLLASLKRAGHESTYVTLHVNLGTFAPLTEENIVEKKLHSEYYEVPESTVKKIARAKKEGRSVIAVGTTALRALESAAKTGALKPQKTTTDLFISEGYQFKIIDGLITNFHVPRSSLLMLVAALIGREKLFDLYKTALMRGFRFLSFGDGMLILPQKFTKKKSA